VPTPKLLLWIRCRLVFGRLLVSLAAPDSLSNRTSPVSVAAPLVFGAWFVTFGGSFGVSSASVCGCRSFRARIRTTRSLQVPASTPVTCSLVDSTELGFRQRQLRCSLRLRRCSLWLRRCSLQLFCLRQLWGLLGSGNFGDAITGYGGAVSGFAPSAVCRFRQRQLRFFLFAGSRVVFCLRQLRGWRSVQLLGLAWVDLVLVLTRTRILAKAGMQSYIGLLGL
jgi:hypothetical protein